MATKPPATLPNPIAREPIPVTVLSGFLGSGKTTLLNRLLHEAHGQKVAVIVNEFGDVGIDGALIAGGERFVELDNGCLCCALNDDLQQALRELVAKKDREGASFDRIVIESTGLASPLPVAWTCTRPATSQRLRVDAIVTVVDAKNIARALRESTEAKIQVEQADLVVLNKLDLVDDGGAAAAAAVTALNPDAPHFSCSHGEVPWSWVMAPPEGGRAPRPHHEHEHDSGHDHGHAAASSHSFASYSFVRPGTAVFDEARCEALAFAVPPEVIRFKALVRVDDHEGPWLLVHGVGGRIDLRFMRPERLPAHSAWVFFGKSLDAASLAALCAEHLEPRAPPPL